jgi:hypothetical protein
MVAGALVPMAVVTDGTQSDEAVAIVHTSITRDFMADVYRIVGARKY